MMYFMLSYVLKKGFKIRVASASFLLLHVHFYTNTNFWYADFIRNKLNTT